MTEERRLAATGMPLEDAISMCHSMRRDGTLPEFIRKEEENRHVCKCGRPGSCPDCPDRNK